MYHTTIRIFLIKKKYFQFLYKLKTLNKIFIHFVHPLFK